MSKFTIAFIVSLSTVIPLGAPCICCLPDLDPEAFTFIRSKSETFPFSLKGILMLSLSSASK